MNDIQNLTVGAGVPVFLLFGDIFEGCYIFDEGSTEIGADEGIRLPNPISAGDLCDDKKGQTSLKNKLKDGPGFPSERRGELRILPAQLGHSPPPPRCTFRQVSLAVKLLPSIFYEWSHLYTWSTRKA
jgi:hypothetical protein